MGKVLEGGNGKDLVKDTIFVWSHTNAKPNRWLSFFQPFWSSGCFFFLSKSKRVNDSDVPLKLARRAGVMQMMKYLQSGLSKNEPSDYAGMWAVSSQQWCNFLAVSTFCLFCPMRVNAFFSLFLIVQLFLTFELLYRASLKATLIKIL